uniref:Uncharacterized protein n=1 Tax=Anguilla anguilla TaxID=7936 RepID=A0A0E9TG68_ANGAN
MVWFLHLSSKRVHLVSHLRSSRIVSGRWRWTALVSRPNDATELQVYMVVIK